MVAAFLTTVCWLTFNTSEILTEEVANFETIIQTCPYSHVKNKMYE